MKTDLDTKKLLVAALTIATAAVVWIGCSSDNTTPTPTGPHTSPFPSCNEIVSNCHEVDFGEGAIHDCHDQGHAAKSDADCQPIKANCLKLCAEAKAAIDAGVVDSGADTGPSPQPDAGPKVEPADAGPDSGDGGT